MVTSVPGGLAIEGMESIVAAVSGFRGTQRFKIIKLISLAGANYVGTMSRSTTHLFCWKFEGKKYNLAKKFGTIIVNQRWLEDCIKARKHIPEHLYTLQSGYEVGSITSELPALYEGTPAPAEKVLPFLESNGCTSMIDGGQEENEDQHDSLLLDESLFPQSRQCKNAPHLSRSKKVNENLLRQDPSKNRNSTCFHPQRSSSQKLQLEESSSDTSKSEVKKRGMYSNNSKGTGPSHRKRRLFRKNVERYLISSDESGAEEEYSSIRIQHRRKAAGSSNHLNNCTQVTANICSTSEFVSAARRGIVMEEVVEVEDAHGIKCIDPLQYPHLQSEGSPVSEERNMQEISSDIEKSIRKLEDGQVADCSARISPPVEVSCAICWTDYSSTRGVLQCGHRFCFSCIQRWADRSVSNGKQTKCPMCAASFTSIIKVDSAGSLDQKVYSQTVPCDSSTKDIFLVPDAEPRCFVYQTSLQSVCYRCQSRAPEDLLMPCRFCGIQHVHSYCLDPPLFPWMCNGCKDLQMLRHHI